MSARKIVIAATAVMLTSPVAAFAAENGTTLAGPAQGSKADGSSSSNHPASADGAMSGGSMERSGGSGAATGTMSGGSTATGGNVGGAAGRKLSRTYPGSRLPGRSLSAGLFYAAPPTPMTDADGSASRLASSRTDDSRPP